MFGNISFMWQYRGLNKKKLLTYSLIHPYKLNYGVRFLLTPIIKPREVNDHF